MKLIVSCILFFNLLHAYTLKETYTYDASILYATDFFPEIKDDFEVLTIPNHLQHFQLSQQRLFELFRRHGITLEGKPLGLVKFKRYSNLDFSKLETAVSDYYHKHLPFLTINRVHIESSRHIKALPQKYQIAFKKQSFKHYKGSFKLFNDKTRIFFNYTLDASYSEFQAQKSIKKGTPITQENTKMTIVPFRRLSKTLIGFEDLDHVEAKRYLKVGKPITRRDVQVTKMIKKGAIVNVKLIEGNILIHFTAQALKSGNLNETITIKKNDGSKIKAKVIGKNEVTIE